MGSSASAPQQADFLLGRCLHRYQLGSEGARARIDGQASTELEILWVRLKKSWGSKFGADLGNVLGEDGAAAILHVHHDSTDSLVARWNKSNPWFEVSQGMIVVEANGERGYWGILEEIRRSGCIELAVQRTPPRENWQADIQNFSAALQGSHGASPFRLRFNPFDENGELDHVGQPYDVVSPPSVLPGDSGAAQCCVCIQDLERDDEVVRLPCNHSYHSLCIARWLTEGDSHACPLCVQPACPERSG